MPRALRVARRHVADLETLLLRREQRIVQLETLVDSLLRANGIPVEANAERFWRGSSCLVVVTQ